MLILVFWLSLAGTLLLILSASLGLQLIPGIGLYGKKRADRIARQPWADLLVFALVALPWIGALLIGGVVGLFGACAGQVLGAIAFAFIHKYSQTQRSRKPGPIKMLARRLGMVRTCAAMLFSLSALPVLIIMRAMQLTIWPLYAMALKLPREPHGAYVSFTRQKTAGLIGLDLLWALYTEWAIGVWAMSAQIMRHSASLWCPMRFGDDAKNTLCTLDFPDVQRWADHGSMDSTVRLIEQMHAPGRTAWFGHASRATQPEQALADEQTGENDDAKQAA